MTEDFDLEELKSAREIVASRLVTLSKNASKNQPQMERALREMDALEVVIGEAQQKQARQNEAEIHPQIEALQERQGVINAEISQLSKQPSKYNAKLQELGKAARALDVEMENLKNQPPVKPESDSL